jgi:DNA mismatch repair ATPase MutL
LDDSTGQRSQQKAPTTTTISMEKIVRDNEIFLFRSVPNKNFVKHTGTSIELFGLFHKHHVRLKQHQQMLQDGNHQVPWSKVRNCVQLLAMAYPHVTIRLYSTKHPAPDTVWVQSASVAKIGPSIDTNRFSMHPLYTMAMKQRLLHLNHGMDGDINNGAFLRVFYSESYNSDDRQFSSKDLTKDTRLAAVINSRQESRKKWVICGMLYEILLQPSNKCESLSSTKNTSKENGFIFVNGRLYKHQSALLDLVLNICHNHELSKGNHSSGFWKSKCFVC